MQGQVVGAGEAAVAVRALERFHTRVLPVVPRQLVRAGKLPRAAVPGALVWLFPCEHTHTHSTASVQCALRSKGRRGFTANRSGRLVVRSHHFLYGAAEGTRAACPVKLVFCVTTM